MLFEPTRATALARAAAVDPQAYARTRNTLGGAVTRLSPYLTHGLVGLHEVYEAVHTRHALHRQHKFVFELGWRAYWRHVWGYCGEGIHSALHPGPLPQSAYQRDMPQDVLHAETGIPVIDLAVKTLYADGYLHNHARMWLASYLVHVRKVHWHTGAQWMLGYLLDGDIASNHLSWQWVAGTASHKPYLFNADNVARYAPAAWHSFGTVLDTDYDTLDALARGHVVLPPAGEFAAEGGVAQGVAVPPLYTQPPALANTPPPWPPPAWPQCSPEPAAAVQGHNVWLHHPWAVHAHASDSGADAVHIAVGVPDCHQAQPWSAQRWAFVAQALRSVTPHLWWGSTPTLARALRGARRVRWYSDPHINSALASMP